MVHKEITEPEVRFELGDLVKKKDNLPFHKSAKNLGTFDVGLVIGIFTSYHADFGKVVYIHVLWQTEDQPVIGRAMTILTQGCLEKVYDKGDNDPDALHKSKQLEIRNMHDNTFEEK